MAVIVRTALVPFACTSSGGVRTMNADPAIRCSTSDGNYRVMSALATASLTIYGIGVPCTYGYFLWKHRDAIAADQAMRVKGEGESSLTNPNIHIRRRFRKLYEDYKPQYMYWKLVLVLRKLALAIIGILLTGNSQLQVRNANKK